jgi:hypothetical protein
LTEALEQKLSHPATSPDFDLHAETNAVLKDIGLTRTKACGTSAGVGGEHCRHERGKWYKKQSEKVSDWQNDEVAHASGLHSRFASETLAR